MLEELSKCVETDAEAGDPEFSLRETSYKYVTEGGKGELCRDK